MKMHHVQNLVESKQIVVQHVGTKEMLADIMTKPISATSLKTSRNAQKICRQETVESHNTAKHVFCAWYFKPDWSHFGRCQHRSRMKEQKSIANQKKNGTPSLENRAKRKSGVLTRHATETRTNQKVNGTTPTAKRDNERAAKFRKLTTEEQSKAWWDSSARG
jgi:hypothetical protein